MEDQQVTDEELFEQSERVIELFKKLEAQLTKDDKELVKESIAEIAVLNAIVHHKQIQEFK